MSRQVIISIVSVVCTVTVIPAMAQNYTELGVMNGTGMVFMPTGSISPNAQFRIDLSRIGLFEYGGHGMNLVSMSSGLSRNLEAYIEFTSEQDGEAQSASAVDIGGKFTLPITVPIVNIVSLWGEFSTSQSEDNSQLYPLNYTRAAVIMTPYTNGFRPSLLIGTAQQRDGGGSLMIGGCVVVSPGHTAQFGIEYLHGDAGSGANDMTVNGNIRLFSNISLHVGPGYMSRPAVSGWIWTIGLSLSSADVDFHPVLVEHKKDYRLPTIEEMEQGSPDDKKDSTEENKQ